MTDMTQDAAPTSRGGRRMLLVSIVAAAVLGAGAFLALLHHLAENLENLGIVGLGGDAFGSGFRPAGDFTVLDRGIDQAKRCQPFGCLVFHGLLQGLIDPCTRIHFSVPIPMASEFGRLSN